MKLVACWLVGVVAVASCVESTTYSGLGDLTISIPSGLDIRDGDTTELPVTVVRGEGHTQAIALEVVGLPATITAEPAEIPAGESVGVIRIRATGATIATEYPVIVKAMSQGFTASEASSFYVIGKAGTVDIAGEISFVRNSKLVATLPSETEFLFFTSAEHCLFDDRGRHDLSFGEDGCIEPARLFRAPPLDVDTHFLFQRDQKIVGVSSYNDSLTPDDIDGLVFFRAMPDGKFDTTYGPAGNDSKAFVPLPGYIARRVGLSPNNEMVVWATNGAGGTMLVRVSSQGVVLGSRVLGAEGDLGMERQDLIAQEDGKVVVAGSNQNTRFITRFNADFTLDLYFGFNGVVTMGARVPHVTQTADGYLAAGQLSTTPTIWRFDTLGKPAPGYTAVGISYPELGTGHFVSAFATKDRLFAAADMTNTALVVSLMPDGAVDRSFAMNGSMHIDYLAPGEHVLEMSPISHARANLWLRTSPAASMIDYTLTRFWY